MKKILVGLLALVFLTTARAEAQRSASHRAAAMDLLLAMHVPEALQASLSTALQVQLQGNPQMRGMEPVLRDFFARYVSWETLKDQYADLYASAFTEDELHQMADFYRTPVGQKLARSSPLLLRQGAELGERAVRQHMPELQEMIRRHLLTRAQP
ncbi:DUF2059 domain-containing protein [Longimicrobium sp.]|uniref:DUF2059 domain-containing protein n=1 Tax=Longimicrobium sp. TaxID=2029185 RepID=UPI002C971EE9|nr:DUF2059 domain-containing protein [Longimicrobium sp.]HSU15446.1 DUF2059 domain-containing protein [Longimicrobium sp.]